MHIRDFDKNDKDGFLNIIDIDESKNSPKIFHKNSLKNNNSQININCILTKNPKTSKFCNNYNISNEIIKTKKRLKYMKTHAKPMIFKIKNIII